MNERDLQQKMANFARAAKRFGNTASGAFATAAATGAVAMAGVAASKLYDAATKSRDYRAMLAVNPEVNEFAKENPARATALFTSLRTLNPAYSKDPFVAGHYMRSMANDPGGEGGYLVTAVQDRARFDAPILETYLKGGIEGVKPRPAPRGGTP